MTKLRLGGNFVTPILRVQDIWGRIGDVYNNIGVPSVADIFLHLRIKINMHINNQQQTSKHCKQKQTVNNELSNKQANNISS